MTQETSKMHRNTKKKVLTKSVVCTSYHSHFQIPSLWYDLRMGVCEELNLVLKIIDQIFKANKK